MLSLLYSPTLTSMVVVIAKSCLTLVTPWTIACQAPLSMGFSRQEYWSELSFPSPGDLPDPGINPTSPALAGEFFTTEQPGKLIFSLNVHKVYLAIFSPLSVLQQGRKGCLSHPGSPRCSVLGTGRNPADVQLTPCMCKTKTLSIAVQHGECSE